MSAAGLGADVRQAYEAAAESAVAGTGPLVVSMLMLTAR